MTCGTYSGSCDYVLTPTLGSLCKYVNVFHLLYIPSGALFRKGCDLAQLWPSDGSLFLFCLGQSGFCCLGQSVSTAFPTVSTALITSHCPKKCKPLGLTNPKAGASLFLLCSVVPLSRMIVGKELSEVSSCC